MVAAISPAGEVTFLTAVYMATLIPIVRYGGRPVKHFAERRVSYGVLSSSVWVSVCASGALAGTGDLVSWLWATGPVVLWLGSSRVPVAVSSAVSSGPSGPSSCSGTGYIKSACQDAQSGGIPPHLFVKQINQESGFQPAARGASGEIGIAQFMPATAAGLGLNPHDPVASLKAAARLMASYQHRFGAYAKALAAYNAGSERVTAALTHGSSWGAYIPVSTRSYVCTIMGELCS